MGELLRKIHVEDWTPPRENGEQISAEEYITQQSLPPPLSSAGAPPQGDESAAFGRYWLDLL